MPRSMVRQLQEAALTGELLERCNRSERLLMRGANRGSRALVTSAMAQRQNSPLLVVVPTTAPGSLLIDGGDPLIAKLGQGFSQILEIDLIPSSQGAAGAGERLRRR